MCFYFEGFFICDEVVSTWGEEKCMDIIIMEWESQKFVEDGEKSLF